MQEAWVKTNRRALAFGALVPAIVALLGGCLAFGAHDGGAPWLHWLGVAILVGATAFALAIVAQLRQPRVAFAHGEVLFYLRSGAPIAVPVAIVEAFFLGQGPLMLPGNAGREEATVNLVARLSQRATDWNERDVKPALGRWHEGYVTIRGTWCERLDGDLIRRLNRRLREVTEEQTIPTIGNQE